MISSDFRAEARRKLSGKWGKAACMTLAYSFVFFVLGFIQGLMPEDSIISSIFSILVYIIEIPLAFGLLLSFINLYNEKEISAFGFFSLGFNNFSKSWGIFFQTLLKMIVPVIVLIVFTIIMTIGLSGSMVSTFVFTNNSASSTSGFMGLFVVGIIGFIASIIWVTVKSYYYMLSYIIAADNPNLTAKEAVAESKELMNGNRAKLFWLQLSFIGWAILATFTFGIGYLWLMPYIQFAMIAFYKNLNGSPVEVEKQDSTDNGPIQ